MGGPASGGGPSSLPPGPPGWYDNVFAARRTHGSPAMTQSATKPKRRRTRDEYDEDLFRDTTMTFGEHLEELRSCLFKAIVGLAIGFVIGLFVGGRVVRFIQTPLERALESHYRIESETKIQAKLEDLKGAGYALPADVTELKKHIARTNLMFEEVYVNPREMLMMLQQVAPEQFAGLTLDGAAPGESPPDGKDHDLARVFFWRPISDDLRIRLISLSPHEVFMIYIKASLVVGAILASPWIFFQIWSFVAAGLYPHERRYVHLFLPISLGLFFAGAALAFFFVFEPVLDFLFRFNRAMGIDPDTRITEWLNFVLVLPLGFGIAFQLPLVMLFLERIGIFDVEAYLSKWKVAILVIAVLSMFLTPADPYSMVLMAIPLTVLYFGGILFCRLMPRGKSPFDELDD
jgi:sec-independent protein translocase protein TatC